MGKRDRGGDPAEPTPQHPPGATGANPNPLEALATTALAAAGDPETVTRGAGGPAPARDERHPPSRCADRAPAPAAPRPADRPPVPPTPAAGRGDGGRQGGRPGATRGAALPAGVAALEEEAALVAAGKLTWRGAERSAWRARVSRARTEPTLEAAKADLARAVAAAEEAPPARPAPPAPPTQAISDARVAALEARVTWLEASLAAVAEAGRGQFEALADAAGGVGGADSANGGLGNAGAEFEG